MHRMSFELIAWDIEADGFKPKQIFCMVVADLLTGEKKIFPPDQIAEGCLLVSQADLLVGHYIRGYDCPVVEKLSQGLIQFDTNKLLDTLDMSKALVKHQAKHSLKVWGDILGLPKMDSPLFEHYDPRMLPYCERDVDITVRLFYHLVDLFLDDPKKTFRNCEAVQIFVDAMVAA